MSSVKNTRCNMKSSSSPAACRGKSINLHNESHHHEVVADRINAKDHSSVVYSVFPLESTN